MALIDSFGSLPVVDVGPLLSARPAGVGEVARQIEAACREHGFFYVTGHGVDPDLLTRLEPACAAFFALPEAEKMEIAMARGGPAWRGYFPVGAELTSGQPDLKEGLYFGPNFTAEIRRCPGGPRSPRAGSPAGTARICTRSPVRTATTCWAGCPRCSRGSGRGC